MESLELNQIKPFVNHLPSYIVDKDSITSHNSCGDFYCISVKQDDVISISEISNILGRIEVYSMQEDQENLTYMYKYLIKKCSEIGIDFNHFLEWIEDNNLKKDVECQGCGDE